ncbi:3-dehydroquinate synthase [Flagellimonas lutaonensis]|uniref:3-dehydroquinate synthase n=1 Tax=Flagellimonas lutaonensis TaxID=516051 RepID=A0A0D5YQ57_9FLAO|nr:3-dehydroquinate synthase [Allomuricauda lutaonensis]AKA33991.1 3-dehydroquinate synthase [Allomuricauda lutaonensis]
MKPVSTISQSFSVQYRYSLYFTEHLFSVENDLFQQVIKEGATTDTAKLLFVVDEGVANAHPALLDEIKVYCHNYGHLSFLDTLLVPGGENSKNDSAQVDRVLKAINHRGVCRHSFVVAIGGGAVIDMVGYAAATAHRGVKLVRVPTTVLAQNDAAVGVKNGINAFGKKNFLGSFTIPTAIINDFRFITTLDQRDWISGVAEAIKVALIKDASFFDFLEKNAVALAKRKKEPMQRLIHRCAEIHMQHISQGGDPFESGSSRPLDFGHWSAHKLEQMTNYDLRHGEAVAMGIALDVTYAHLMGMIDNGTLKRVLKVLCEVGFDLKMPIKGEPRVTELLKGIEEFREHLGGKLTITLIVGIGKKVDVHKIDEQKMREAIAIRSVAVEKLSC